MWCKKPDKGVIGYFNSPETLTSAMENVRDANYQYFDAFTPFPVHGLEHAQGLKRSWLPYVTMIFGMTGGILGFTVQYWTSAIDWPLIVGGKPFNSWPAFVPIIFELTVLLAALSTVAAMFIANGLPNIKRKSLDPRLTNDKFAIVIQEPPVVEEDDCKWFQSKKTFRAYNPNDAQDLLKKLGASEVRTYTEEGWF